MSNYKARLEYVNKLKDELKARANIYQCDAKERIAEWFNLPIDTCYDYPYKDWVEASRRMEGFLEQMRTHREDFEKWIGHSVYTVPYTEWKNDFIAYCKESNVTLIQPYIR